MLLLQPQQHGVQHQVTPVVSKLCVVTSIDTRQWVVVDVCCCPPVAELMRNPAFLALWVSSLVSLLGDWFNMVALLSLLR